MICHKNHPNLLHNPTLAISGLLQILYIIPNNFLGNRLWVTVKCLDIHTLSLATHQTPNSNISLPRTISSCISQVMVLSITNVWHFNHDTTIRLLSKIFFINVILSSANAFSNSSNNGSPAPIFSKSST